MIIQLFIPIVHIFVHGFELLDNIRIAFAAVELGFVAGIKYLRHIKPVEPHLIGVDFFYARSCPPRYGAVPLTACATA